MGDGRINRVIDQGKARTDDFKARVPELRERMPDLGERATGLRSKGTELRSRGTELARQYARMDVSWARCGYARALRQMILTGILGPMIDFYVTKSSAGTEVFDELDQPVIFVANHSSHLDTPTILRAIPHHWRTKTAVAAAADYFYKSRWKANGVALLFNTVPLGRSGGGLGNGATDHLDRLIDQGWNVLLFPEGTRSRDGSIGKIRSGAAVIAAQHDIPIVPIYVSGTHDAMPPGQNWPKRKKGKLFSRRHKVQVRFGEPIAPRDPAERREVMDQVRAFWERKGEPADPAKRGPAYDVLILHEAFRAHEAQLARQGRRRFDPSLPLTVEPVEDRPSPAA
jgi:1-acyl-sn-glycerol-3-phosphate acyltransferase